MKKNVLFYVLSALLVIALLCSIACATLLAVFNVNTVQKRLETDAFYNLSQQSIRNNLNGLSGVIAVDADAVIQAIPTDTIRQSLSDHSRSVTEGLLEGKEIRSDIAITSDAVYQLVCDSITAEQYGANTEELDKDRADAYADLMKAVNDGVLFFPQTLYGKITEAVPRLQTAYSLVRLVKRLTIPFVCLTVLLGVAVFFCRRERKGGALRTVAGCVFIPSSALFLLAAFLHRTPLLQRISLGEGLLREYVLTMADCMLDGVFTVMTIFFVIGILLLVAAIAWQVADNTCKDTKTVIQ